MTGDDPCTLADILPSDALARRPSRAPDHVAEARALGTLAQTLATNPLGLFQKVAETVMALCGAESAGVSILEPGEPDGEHGDFHWHATAGVFAPYAGTTLPRAASPCGDVTARDAVLLFDRPGRHFPGIARVDPPIREGLFAPWRVGGVPAGTLWVIHHAPDRHFDAEDARLLASIAPFAAAAWQTVRALEAAGAGGDVSDRRVLARLVELDAAHAALRASEARLGVIFAQAAVGLSELSVEGRFLRVNAEMCRILGRSPGELPGLDVWAVTHADDVAPTLAAVGAALTSGGPVVIDKRYLRPDGALVWASSSVMRLTDEHGRPANLLAVTVDISARKQAEAALRASEARYRTLVENVSDYAIFLLDAEGRVTEWTAGAEAVKGYTAAEAVGRPVELFYRPEDVAAGVPARELAEIAAAGRGEWEGWRVRKDGTRFWANEIGTAVRDTDGRLVGFVKISRDLTDRRLAEEAAERAQLAAARDELRRALAQTEEAERRRLARELHDQLGQELTALRLGLDEATRIAAAHQDARATSDAGLLQHLGQLQNLAQRMTTGARYLALELRPPELDDLGLESALATFVAEWSARFGVTAEVEVTGGVERTLPPEVSSTLYRIVQEALTNVAKHARAREVSVIVEKPDNEVRLIVEDDGAGFDPDEVAMRARRDRRLGLAGMRERAALVGGTLAVESSPGAGTTVYVRLPVERARVDVFGAADAGADAWAGTAVAEGEGAAPATHPAAGETP